MKRNKSLQERCRDLVLTLKAVREEKDISTYKLEKLTGISQSNLSRMENSQEYTPNLKTLMRVADVLDVEIRIVDKNGQVIQH